jgi:hypothetical protein
MSTCYTDDVNFSVYLDDASVRRLDAICAKTGTSRNALIRRAIADLLDRERPSWPAEVLSFQPDATFPPFESHRRELARPVDDPFGGGDLRQTPRRARRKRTGG